MAIADAEPKKGDGDVITGSGSSRDVRKSRGPIKFSSLKDFSFSVSDVWDDRNISTFIECCHTNIEDLKNYCGSDDTKVWEKIARCGLERGGSVNCFNVNYCLELARCLRNFVIKNKEKMMDNEVFKMLHEDVSELLPYFATGSTSRQRSRSKSIETSKSPDCTTRVEENKLIAHAKTDHLAIPPFGTSSESTQVMRKVAKILKKYEIDDFVKSSSRNAIWKEVANNVEKDFGVQVNPRVFLEGYKRSVVGFVRSISDSKERMKIFREQVDDLLPFFDHIAPRSMKKSEFLIYDDDFTELEILPTLEAKKRKETEEQDVDGSSPPKKRLNSGGESLVDSGDIPLTTNMDKPLRTYLKKKSTYDCDYKSKKSKHGDDSDDSCPEGMDFLDEWNNDSNDGSVEPPRDKSEPVKEKTPVEVEPTPIETPAPKRRGRKPKTPKPGVIPIRKTMVSRLDEKKEKNVGESGKLDSRATPPVSASKEVVPVSRFLPNALRKDGLSDDKDQGSSPRNKHYEKKGDVTVIIHNETRPYVESDDSDIEDVPLMGTNIRVHTKREQVERSKPNYLRGNMNPIVLLDRLNVDSYLSGASTSEQPKPINRTLSTIQTRGKRVQVTERSKVQPSHTEPNVEGAAPTPRPVRKRGRPRVHPIKPTYPSNSRGRAVPLRREATPEEAPSNVEIVRQRTTLQPVNRSLIVRELENRPTTIQQPCQLLHIPSPLSPPAMSSSLTESYGLRLNSDAHPPVWFERFIQETRRHEMWKIHQLMKMQQELLDSEFKKRGVLEKILSALEGRS